MSDTTEGTPAAQPETIAAPPEPMTLETVPVIETKQGLTAEEVAAEAERIFAEAAKAEEEDAPKAEAKTEEPSTEVKHEKLPTEERRSKKIAEEAKREAQNRKVAKELAAKEQRIKDLEEISAKVKAGEADPDDLLSVFGLDYRKITEGKLRHGKPAPSPVDEVKAEVEELKRQLAERDQAIATARQQQEAQEATKALMATITEQLQASESLSDVLAAGRAEEVLREQQEHWKKTYDPDTNEGEYLTVEDAAAKVLARMEQEVERLVATKLARAKFAQVSASKAAPQATPGQVQSRTPRTLTNGLVGGAPGKSPDGITRYDTAEAAKAAILAAINAGDIKL